MLQYDAKAWGVSAAYDRQDGGPGGAANLFNGLAPLALTQSGNRDSRLLLDAYVKFDKLMFGAVWLNRRVDSASASTPGTTSNQFALEAQYKLSPAMVFDAMVQHVINGQQDTRATAEMVRATYALSLRTAVYAQVAVLQNSAEAAYSVSSGGASTPGKGMGQVGTMLGIRHSF